VRNVSDKIIENIETFYVQELSEYRFVYEIMWKNMVKSWTGYI
jgi:hypothetical protein